MTLFARADTSIKGRPFASEHRQAIDGLRAVAILGVLLYHLDHRWLPGGFLGVDVFFVISGYLITSILVRDWQGGSSGLSRFYQRRISRLLPAFVTMALATLAAASLIYSEQDLASAGINLSAAAASLENFKAVHQGSYFALSPDAQPFLHCWSLSVEEQFYIVFPATLFLISRASPTFTRLSLGALLAASLTACVIMTRAHSPWAFFMLPTRAWELLAGSLLAVCRVNPGSVPRIVRVLPPVGLILIAVSLALKADVNAFPGYLAILPTAGSIMVLGPVVVPNGVVERLLSWGPMTLIGRLSYSLYLWHWPVFSLVDYRLYLEPAPVRILLKVGISCLAASLCYVAIERPGRRYFNAPGSRLAAFSFLGLSLAVFVPLGIFVRREHFINANLEDVRNGGLRFNRSAASGTMVLMGDSNASMYGELAKEIAFDHHLSLTVISVAAGDPLPRLSGPNQQLWEYSVAVVKRENPDVLIFICDWPSKLGYDGTELDAALRELSPLARHIILVSTPPRLPANATREAMREGSKPPFKEDPSVKVVRGAANDLVRSSRSTNVAVVDIEHLFVSADGTIKLLDLEGRPLYQDAGHLSAAGAELAKPLILRAISPL
jgi:peptidoglycan/LPS O-acetylase OafA/YrhL